MVVSPKIFNSALWKRLSGSIEASIIQSLLIRANKKTMQAYPNIETIAIDTRSSEPTVKRAIKRLEKKNCLIVIRRKTFYKKKGHNTIKRKNEYDLSQWKRYCLLDKNAKDGQNEPSQK